MNIYPKKLKTLLTEDLPDGTAFRDEWQDEWQDEWTDRLLNRNRPIMQPYKQPYKQVVPAPMPKLNSTEQSRPNIAQAPYRPTPSSAPNSMGQIQA